MNFVPGGSKTNFGAFPPGAASLSLQIRAPSSCATLEMCACVLMSVSVPAERVWRARGGRGQVSVRGARKCAADDTETKWAKSIIGGNTLPREEFPRPRCDQKKKKV